MWRRRRKGPTHPYSHSDKPVAGNAPEENLMPLGVLCFVTKWRTMFDPCPLPSISDLTKTYVANVTMKSW